MRTRGRGRILWFRNRLERCVSDSIMSDMMPFDGIVPVCSRIIELTDNHLFDNYFCNNCGHSKDEHMRKRIHTKLSFYLHHLFKDAPTDNVDFIYASSDNDAEQESTSVSIFHDFIHSIGKNLAGKNRR